MRRSFPAMLCLACAVAASAADLYDPSTGQLSIASLAIGNATYNDVLITVGSVVGRPVGNSPYGNEDRYDPVSKHLTVQSVTAGDAVYFNAVGTVSELLSIGAVSGADSYDGSHLSIAAVQVGDSAYYDVVVTVDSVLGVAGGMPGAELDSYDASTRQLNIAAVTYGGKVYTNVVATVGTVLSVGAQSGESQSGTVLYLQSRANGHTARIGLDTNWGGAVVEVSLDGTNFVNAHDTGREVQPAVYDAAGAAGANGWDPVLGGDKYDRGSPVLVQQTAAASLYTKAIPLQWNPDAFGGGVNAPVDTDMTFEQTVTLAPGVPLGFRLHLKLAHTGTDTHYVTEQEFPAVYANSAYTMLDYYGGAAPWTGGDMTTLPIATTWSSVYAPEQSAALVDTNNQGLTVYVPGSYPIWSTVYFPQSGGSGPSGDATAYMRPWTEFNFAPGQFVEGDIYLIPGDAAAARTAVYALHQSVAPNRVAAALGSVDVPVPNAVISGAGFVVAGWAFGNAPVTAVNVYVDGTLVGPALLGFARPDVAAAYPQLAPVDCGWNYSLDTTALANGTHTLAVHIVDSSGSESLMLPVAVNVTN